jgi:hypothetical protein
MPILCSYLPPERAKAALKNGLNAAAIRAMRRSRELWRKQKYAVARAQFREAARCGLRPTVLKHVLMTLAWMAMRDIARPATADPADLHSPAAREPA